MIDIIERLVRFAGKVCLSTDTELEAADEICRLRLENERLRSALKPFADSHTNEEFEYSATIFKSSELRAAAEAIMDETK